MQLRGRRAVGGMHDHRLHAADRSPVVRAAQPVRAYDPALQSRWPAPRPKPVRSMMQNISGNLLDGGAEPHDLTGDAGDRAGSLDDDEQRA
eukprot:5408734-Prymnesium_polylepis.1